MSPLKITLIIEGFLKPSPRDRDQDITQTAMVHSWMNRRISLLLRVAVFLMALAATVWLAYEFYRLLWQPTQIGSYSVHPGAIDLKQRCREVHLWFAGMPVYDTIPTALYPPASYLILWPLLGWLSITSAVYLWTLTTVAALVWLIYLIIQQSTANTRLECIFVGLIPLSMYATGAVIGNGQLLIHIIAILVALGLLVRQKQSGWLRDLLAAALMLLALVKPNISAPFFWIVLFIGGPRPALLTVGGYAAATIFAASFQKPGVWELLTLWIKCAAEKSGVSYEFSYASIHSLLSGLGLDAWNLLASGLLLAALGIWVYYNRHRDLWLLLAVTAVVARIYTYHLWYDDLLMLFPMVALFRIAKCDPHVNGPNVFSGVLLGISLVLMIAPGGLHLLPQPWNGLYIWTQTILWIVLLVYLLTKCGQEGKGDPEDQPSISPP
jgi:hypothetical protein